MPRSAVLAILLEQRRDCGAEGVRHFDERPNGRISVPPLQVPQIAALHRCALGELLLRPILRAPERFDPLSKEFQNLGLGCRQLLMVSEFVIDCCTIRVTIEAGGKMRRPVQGAISFIYTRIRGRQLKPAPYRISEGSVPRPDKGESA